MEHIINFNCNGDTYSLKLKATLQMAIDIFWYLVHMYTFPEEEEKKSCYLNYTQSEKVIKLFLAIAHKSRAK